MTVNTRAFLPPNRHRPCWKNRQTTILSKAGGARYNCLTRNPPLKGTLRLRCFKGLTQPEPGGSNRPRHSNLYERCFGFANACWKLEQSSSISVCQSPLIRDSWVLQYQTPDGRLSRPKCWRCMYILVLVIYAFTSLNPSPTRSYCERPRYTQ